MFELKIKYKIWNHRTVRDGNIGKVQMNLGLGTWAFTTINPES